MDWQKLDLAKASVLKREVDVVLQKMYDTNPEVNKTKLCSAVQYRIQELENFCALNSGGTDCILPNLILNDVVIVVPFNLQMRGLFYFKRKDCDCGKHFNHSLPPPETLAQSIPMIDRRVPQEPHQTTSCTTQARRRQSRRAPTWLLPQHLLCIPREPCPQHIVLPAAVSRQRPRVGDLTRAVVPARIPARW